MESRVGRVEYEELSTTESRVRKVKYGELSTES